jgi:hypothetical protein
VLQGLLQLLRLWWGVPEVWACRLEKGSRE